MLRFLPASARPAVALDAAGSGDADLARRVRAGDLQAIDEVYRRESARIYRYVLAWCGDASWAADAVHDAFVALAEDAAGFDPDRGTLGAWLAGVARHAVLGRWRTQRREVTGDGSDDAGEPDDLPADSAAQGASPEAALVRAQDVARVWQALRALPLAQGEAIVLVDLQDRPYAEAARIVGVDVNTLRTRLHRGRLRLARALRDDVPAPWSRSPGERDERSD